MTDDDESRARAALRAAIQDAGASVAAGGVFDVPAHERGWLDTGLDLEPGEAVSLLPSGVVWLSRVLDIQVRANGALWYRIGEGPIAKCVGLTATFVVDRAGSLRLTCGLAAQWAAPDGTLVGGDLPPLEGGFILAVLVWRGAPEAALARFAAHDATGLAHRERERLLSNRPLPKGWAPLWQVGETGVFCEALDGERPVIACECRQDAAIVKHALDAMLDETTRLAWSWRVSELPSTLAEDRLQTHDYLSIAVEFENGHDLTYFWSAALPVETAFACPIPGWTQRETHLVVRSGREGLGRWLDEARPILADYRRAVGDEHPGRIVGIWLIALSPFQRGTGRCDFSGIRLLQADTSIAVAP